MSQNKKKKQKKANSNFYKKNDNIQGKKFKQEKKLKQEKHSQSINKPKINEKEDMISFTNYDLNINKKLLLSEEKKNDIENIFTQNKNIKNNKTSKKVWKVLSLILFIVVILLSFVIYNLKESENNEPEECVIPNDDIVIEEPEKTEKNERYLFLGDSIFEQYNVNEFFKEYDVVNSGISGVTAHETIDNLENTVYSHNPTTIFMLLGTNDLYKEYNPVETFESIKKIIEKIQQEKPEIKINVISVLPINTSDNGKINPETYRNRTNEKIDEINKYLKEYCEKINLNYINAHDILLDKDGQLKLDYTRDGLHITDLGYYHITMEILNYL